MARILALLCAVLALCQLAHMAQVKQLKWWETASFYQIYPRSFKDSDGDGVGDLNGVTQQLPYLKELGITATWLSPIFTSPMADFGYDIANFTEIDPIFGTMEDFEALIAKAKEVGVKIILDFVPNHSSDECDWFKKSAANKRLYSNYYVWHPGKMVNGIRQPPTNWISVFRGSQWTWHEERQEYYLHQFLAKQPDFNYRNPVVKEMMKDVLRFWLRKGVSGFRVDAVPHVFEVAPDADGNYPDEPRNTAVRDPEDYGYLDHIYTVHQPETIDLVYEFRSVMDEMKVELGTDEDLILMTEAYAPMDVLMQYYGNEEVDGAHIPFNFELINSLTATSTAYEYDQLIRNWLINMPEGRTANWVLGNHDKSRVGTRMGADRIDMMNILLFTLPGCSVTYQGEEIGMTDVWISWNDTVDPQACQSNQNIYETLSRDPVRTPFQWSDTKMAGFTSGSSTWLPIASNYRSVNVKVERASPQSHLNIFKELKALRNEKSFQLGDTDVRALNANVLVIKRWIYGSDAFIILLNVNDSLETVDLTAVYNDLKASLTYALVTPKSLKRKGDTVRANDVILLPKEAVVLRSAA